MPSPIIRLSRVVAHRHETCYDMSRPLRKQTDVSIIFFQTSYKPVDEEFKQRVDLVSALTRPSTAMLRQALFDAAAMTKFQ